MSSQIVIISLLIGIYLLIRLIDNLHRKTKFWNGLYWAEIEEDDKEFGEVTITHSIPIDGAGGPALGHKLSRECPCHPEIKVCGDTVYVNHYVD